MLKKVNQWLKIVQQGLASCLYFPGYCLLCLSSTKGSIVCTDCEQTLPWFKGPYSKECRALFTYEPPLTRFITELKFQNKLYFAKWIANQMLQTWSRPEVDCIVAMPLHPCRQKQRGYNQTLEIAREIAFAWQIPLDRWHCTRIKRTLPQSELTASRRKINVSASSFNIHSIMQGKRVLVIEDVVTTGTTWRAFQSALYQAGVKEAKLWACCQTIK